MGLRTYQVLGKAYSTDGDVTVVANIDGVEVHNGIVTTTATAIPDLQDHEALFSFDMEDTRYGNIVPSSFTVTGGTVFIAGLAANNMIWDNLTAFSELWQFDDGDENTNLKTNIILDGIERDAFEPADGFHYEIPDGSTMTIDWNIPAPRGNVPGHMRIRPKDTIVGVEYKILRDGSRNVLTDFVAMGAPNNTQGTVFTVTTVPTGPGIGSGKLVQTKG